MAENTGMEKRKRKWGDRRDGYLVKQHGLQTVMGYLLPKRTECECYLHDTFDITDLLAYIDKKNAEHPEYKTTVFHCAIAGLARMVMERPKLNRFIQGWRTYERYDVSLSFVVKRRFTDGADESLMVLTPGKDDTLDTINRFFENNLNVSETARKLYVHRNTLVYRLEKVKKITGLDLREFEDAILFKVAVMVKQYLNSQNSNKF